MWLSYAFEAVLTEVTKVERGAEMVHVHLGSFAGL
jgi:hypothetical protein